MERRQFVLGSIAVAVAGLPTGACGGGRNAPELVVQPANSQETVTDGAGQTVRIDRDQGTVSTGGRSLVVPQPVAASASSHYAAVIDLSSHSLTIYGRNGAVLRKGGSFGRGKGQLAYPEDCVVRADGSVAVADTLNHRIALFGPNGSWTYWGEPGLRAGQLNGPRRLALLPTGQLAVLNAGNLRLQVLEATGQLAVEWDLTSAATPRALVADEQHLYVADSSRCEVVTWTFDGDLVERTLVTDADGKLRTPVALHFDDLGRLAVSTWSRESNA